MAGSDESGWGKSEDSEEAPNIAPEVDDAKNGSGEDVAGANGGDVFPNLETPRSGNGEESRIVPEGGTYENIILARYNDIKNKTVKAISAHA